MTTLAGGIAAVIIGFIFLGLWWEPFVELIKGAIPLLVILGGALAAYLGYEEWKDAQSVTQNPTTAGTGDADRYRAEAEKYKAELEALKKDQTTPPSSGETSDQ